MITDLTTALMTLQVIEPYEAAKTTNILIGCAFTIGGPVGIWLQRLGRTFTERTAGRKPVRPGGDNTGQHWATNPAVGTRDHWRGRHTGAAVQRGRHALGNPDLTIGRPVPVAVLLAQVAEARAAAEAEQAAQVTA